MLLEPSFRSCLGATPSHYKPPGGSVGRQDGAAGSLHAPALTRLLSMRPPSWFPCSASSLHGSPLLLSVALQACGEQLQPSEHEEHPWSSLRRCLPEAGPGTAPGMLPHSPCIWAWMCLPGASSSHLLSRLGCFEWSDPSLPPRAGTPWNTVPSTQLT